MQSFYKTLANIFQYTPQQAQHHTLQETTHPEIILQKFALAYANKQISPEIINKFISYMHQQRYVKLLPQFINDLKTVQILCCNESKVLHFDIQSRAYCIYGRAVSVIKRKGKEFQSQRKDLYSEIQNAVFNLCQQNLFPLSKNQSHQIDDVLLHFDVPNEVDPIILSSEVFSPFVPQPFAIVMVIPFNWPRPQPLFNFIKGSLLHMYNDNINALNKVIFRQNLYKNSIVKGIYFIEQGEVQSTNGRIIARGWVTNGKCKNSGFGWKFKPIVFFRSLAKNQNFWKQFLNDLRLNGEYPFKMSYILGIQNEVQGYQTFQGKGKKIKLPKIIHTSFDYSKLIEIQKVKHYDDRINDICEFKQKLILKRNQDNLKRSMDINRGRQKNEKKRVILKHLSTGKHMTSNSSSQNILIMSVLKRLQGLTQQNTTIQNHKKKQKIRISPAKLFQQSRIQKKRRYNQ